MGSRNDEAPFVLAQAGPLNGQSWILNKNFILGREPDCDIVISNRQVSRHHASLTPGAEGVTLQDLGSKNGVLYNNKPLNTAVLLNDGDVFQVALVQRFVYLCSDSTIPLENQPPLERGTGTSQLNSSPARPAAGRLRLDKKSRQVWIQKSTSNGRIENKEILPPLSVSQFRLLEVLYDHLGQVIQREGLAVAVWGENQAFDISEQALDALIRRLRDRIASVDSERMYIVTVRGHGLKLVNPPISSE